MIIYYLLDYLKSLQYYIHILIMKLYSYVIYHLIKINNLLIFNIQENNVYFNINFFLWSHKGTYYRMNIYLFYNKISNNNKKNISL